MMTTSKTAFQAVSAVLIAGVCTSVMGSPAMAAEITTLQTLAAPDGETYFAVSVKADSVGLPAVSMNHVVLMDTSASQVGEHREHAFAVLESFLASLPKADRVTVFAVDVTPTQITDTFVPPSYASQVALGTLNKRFPAGSTDMPAALLAARKSLAGHAPAAITYIGDGMSTANLIPHKDMQTILGDLVQDRIAVHTYAVGPNKDRQLLGILSHHSGGIAMTDDRSVADVDGRELAVATRRPVTYPTEMPLIADEADMIPSHPLPLRSDRETVYIGRGAAPQVAANVTVNDKGNTFLHGFYRQAESNGGLNPFAGMVAFRDAQQAFEDEIARLETVGQQALANGQFQQAEDIGLTLKSFDPHNVRAETIIGRAGDLRVDMVAQVVEDNPFAQPGAAQPAPAPAQPKQPAPAQPAGNNPFAEPAQQAPPAMQAIPPAQLLNQSNGLFQREMPPAASLIEQEEVRRKIMTEKLVTEINTIVDLSRQRVTADPNGVLADLEAALGAVKSATEIDPEVRSELLRKVSGTILDVNSRREALLAVQLRSQQRRAEQEAQRRLVDRMMLDELRLAQLVDRIRALMYEGFQGNFDAFEEAEAVARQVESMEPGSAIGSQVVYTTEAAGQLDKAFRLRSLRADRWLATLYQVELSHVPFPDEPPVRYPPAPVWRALTERRAKWASVDLHQNSPNEQRIYNELDKETEVEFIDTPLTDAIDYIQSVHNITILVDEIALTDVGIPTDEPISLILNGVKLRSAMKIMLEGLGLTWVIEDEVMKITTAEIADEKTQTRVYPVGDLVISPGVQLQNVQSQGGGGQGGGLGGGQGGQQGGGQQGGGQGGGGGGGFFSVSDDLAPLKKKPAMGN